MQEVRGQRFAAALAYGHCGVEGRRPLFLKIANRGHECAVRLLVGGVHPLEDFLLGDDERVLDLPRIEPLPIGALLGWSAPGGLHIVRKLAHLLLKDLLAMGSLELELALLQRLLQSIHPLIFGAIALDHLFGRQRKFTWACREEYGLNPVIILLRNWIELMVVAAGAADSHPEKRQRCCGEQIV